MFSRPDHLRLLPRCPGQPTQPRDQAAMHALFERAHAPLGVACSVCGKAAASYNMAADGVCAECTANPVRARAKRDKLARWRKAAAKVLGLRRAK